MPFVAGLVYHYIFASLSNAASGTVLYFGSIPGELTNSWQMLPPAWPFSLPPRLKTKEIERREWPVFADLADARVSVADYFDCYNYERLHCSIGYQLPHLACQQLLQSTTLNFPAQLDHLINAKSSKSKKTLKTASVTRGATFRGFRMQTVAV